MSMEPYSGPEVYIKCSIKKGKCMKDENRVRPNSPVFSAATTDDERDAQLSSLAMDAIEQRIREGKASQSELLFCAKLGREETKLEKQQLKENVTLLKARTEDLQRSKNSEELYKQAIEAFQEYSGANYVDEEGEFIEY